MTSGEHPGGPAWFSAVEAAHIVAAADDIAWDDTADFIVIGYGGAGVAAALEAAERGAHVLAVDRFHGGGATAMNGGVVYAGGGTRPQAEAGVTDTPEAMFAYLQKEVGGVVSDRTLMRFCSESAAELAWLEARGVRFGSAYCREKTSYPTTEWYLYHSDSSLTPEFKAISPPAPRGHRVALPGTGSAVGYGRGLYDPLREAASRAGVRTMLKAEARQLVLDRTGRVLGVKVLQIPPDTPEAAAHEKLEAQGIKLLLSFPPAFPGASLFIARAQRLLARARALEAAHRVPRYLRARDGICLSGGGFVFNREMVRHYAPAFLAGMPLGSPADDGSAIRLGQTAGGATARMDHISAWRFINPPLAWARGMLVNARGERFVNEMLYGAAIGAALMAQPGGRAWLVLDATLAQETWRELRHARMLSFQRLPAILAMLFGARRARSLDALARACGMDPAALRASAAAPSPDPFRRADEDHRPLATPPFLALDMSADAKLAPLPTLTLGGLRVDEDTGEVLGQGGAPIPGLYAAGRTAIGICSNIYVSGLSAADCVFSGRRAGAHAAASRLARAA